MEIIRYLTPQGDIQVGVRDSKHRVGPLPVHSISELLGYSLDEIRRMTERAALQPAEGHVRILPPADGLMEVWAAGVTYLRSRTARADESQFAGVYDSVYNSSRPELFLKCIAWRLCGDGEPIAVRLDSSVDVPEPELALVVNARQEIVGYTVCNDVSSRSLEGDNPLYLPQAKIFAGACSLGPAIRPIWEVNDAMSLRIDLRIQRGRHEVFTGSTNTDQLRRTFDDLVEHLFRAELFPHGVVLSTGTGIVPDLTFSLEVGDLVSISVEQIGRLTNRVVSGLPDMAWLTQAAKHPESRMAVAT